MIRRLVRALAALLSDPSPRDPSPRDRLPARYWLLTRLGLAIAAIALSSCTPASSRSAPSPCPAEWPDSVAAHRLYSSDSSLVLVSVTCSRR